MNKLLITGLALFLVSCGGAEKGTESQTSAPSTPVETPSEAPKSDSELAKILPTDPALKAKYEASCISCHAVTAAQSPLVGDAAEWEKRISEKTIEGLVANAKNGINAMPPMGLCMDCSDDDLKNLILFMAGK
ncbi:MAG: cytochrome c5 family protein [Flavobacteriaceae bacterium]|nr:MAG: cytochrome c5 family protein [Flavobacteriaceae bacterium]